ncbi:MAG: hypothetical protein IPI23_07755 [Bacteroidetes bacterium]|nr:hypothetical protein [Bacteroidota bacterium]
MRNLLQENPISVSEAWDFLSSPANLKNYTSLKWALKLLLILEVKNGCGQIISHIVKPLAGIPMRWVTEINALM